MVTTTTQTKVVWVPLLPSRVWRKEQVWMLHYCFCFKKILNYSWWRVNVIFLEKYRHVHERFFLSIGKKLKKWLDTFPEYTKCFYRNKQSWILHHALKRKSQQGDHDGQLQIVLKKLLPSRSFFGTTVEKTVRIVKSFLVRNKSPVSMPQQFPSY